MTVTPETILRRASGVQCTRADTIKPSVKSNRKDPTYTDATAADEVDENDNEGHSNWPRSTSPVSSDSNSSDASSVDASLTSRCGSVSSPNSRLTTLTSAEALKWKSSLLVSKSSNLPYVMTSPQPSPLAAEFDHGAIITTAAIRVYRDSEEASGILQQPSNISDDTPLNDEDKTVSQWSSTAVSPSPSTPAFRYHGWVNEVIAPISNFIDDTVDPRDLFADLQEIAEGESGSVYAARVVNHSSAKSEPHSVAIKQVALLPSGSQKLLDLETELRIIKNARHSHILAMDMLYVDPIEDTLWISMELMDRSLADILSLSDEGVTVTEAHISHFAKDVSDC